MFSGWIVGYSLAERIGSRLAVDALTIPVVPPRRRPGPARCLVYSGRGSQFPSRPFLAELRHHDLVEFLGHVPCAGDNAAVESFSALLQKSVRYRCRWTTPTELRIFIVTWLNGYSTAADAKPDFADSPQSSRRQFPPLRSHVPPETYCHPSVQRSTPTGI